MASAQHPLLEKRQTKHCSLCSWSCCCCFRCGLLPALRRDRKHASEVRGALLHAVSGRDIAKLQADADSIKSRLPNCEPPTSCLSDDHSHSSKASPPSHDHKSSGHNCAGTPKAEAQLQTKQQSDGSEHSQPSLQQTDASEIDLDSLDMSLAADGCTSAPKGEANPGIARTRSDWAFIDGSDLLPSANQARQGGLRPRPCVGEDLSSRRQMPFAPNGVQQPVPKTPQPKPPKQGQLQWEDACLTLAQQALLRRDELRPLLGLKLKLPLGQAFGSPVASPKCTSGTGAADWVNSAGTHITPPAAGTYSRADAVYSGIDDVNCTSADSGDTEAAMEYFPELLVPLDGELDGNGEIQGSIFDDVQVMSAPMDADTFFNMCQPLPCRHDPRPSWLPGDICTRQDDTPDRFKDIGALPLEGLGFDEMPFDPVSREPPFPISSESMPRRAEIVLDEPGLAQSTEVSGRLPRSRPAQPGLGSLPRPIPKRPQQLNSKLEMDSDAQAHQYGLTEYADGWTV